MAKKTVVQWFIERVIERWIPDTVLIKSRKEWNNDASFARELFRDQIMAAHIAGQESAYQFKEKETAEEYYNKNYGSK